MPNVDVLHCGSHNAHYQHRYFKGDDGVSRMDSRILENAENVNLLGFAEHTCPGWAEYRTLPCSLCTSGQQSGPHHYVHNGGVVYCEGTNSVQEDASGQLYTTVAMRAVCRVFPDDAARLYERGLFKEKAGAGLRVKVPALGVATIKSWYWTGITDGSGELQLHLDVHARVVFEQVRNLDYTLPLVDDEGEPITPPPPVATTTEPPLPPVPLEIGALVAQAVLAQQGSLTPQGGVVTEGMPTSQGVPTNEGGVPNA